MREKPVFFGIKVTLEFNTFVAEYEGGSHIILKSHLLPGGGGEEREYGSIKVWDDKFQRPTIEFTPTGVYLAINDLIIKDDDLVHPEA